jgi:hypothetical protein
MQGPGPDERLTHAAVLAILAESLVDLSDRVAGIETYAATFATAAARNPRVTAALQDLDLVRQTIEDLGRLAAVAAGGEAQPAAQLAGSLRLEALRNRLPGRSAAVLPVPERRSDPGEVDLFVARSPSR